MKLEEVFDTKDFTEQELERLEHELAIIEQAQCEQTIIKAIEEIRAIPPEKEFYMYGAVNCSFLLYALGITKVDPLRFDLPFERFVNPLRDPTHVIIQPEFVSKAHIKTNLTLEELTLSQVKDEETDVKAIPMSKYKSQPLYDILYETRGTLLWQEQFINILNRVGGMLPEHADTARRVLCKYGRNSVQCETYYDWFLAHSERLGYDRFELIDYTDGLFHDILYARNKSHYLAHAIHTYDFAQTPNEKRTAVICFEKSYSIVKHMSSPKIAAYRCFGLHSSLKDVIANDRDLHNQSNNRMSVNDFKIYTDEELENGVKKYNGEGKIYTKFLESDFKEYIINLKSKGIEKIIVISSSDSIECILAKLTNNICKQEKVACDIYAYHVGEVLLPDTSPQAKRIFDLRESCDAEMLPYPPIGDDYCSLSVLEDIDKQYAKAIEYTCL